MCHLACVEYAFCYMLDPCTGGQYSLSERKSAGRLTLNLALSNLFQDKLRFALSVIGIALAVMLILFLLGLRAGVFRSAVMYLDNTPGSVAVMPQGVKSTSAGSGQFLPPETVDAVSSAPGVDRVTPVLA